MKPDRHISLVCIIFISCLAVGNCGFMSWFFSEGNEGGSQEESSEDGHQMPSKQSVPFEMMIGDEKFQLQAQFVQDLSPLDYCHHQVVYDIESSCSEMTEEDLGKLSVQLLNCQLEAEKRETFPCHHKMSLAECTKPMDATVWNAYQIVSNRARAVCYAARQQQFRMRTELTVNALVHTTQDQLVSMKRMEEAQNDLKSVTSETLDEVHKGQERLVAAQSHLERSQAQISSSMSSNLFALMREKALIAAGNSELAKMTEAIKRKLDSTSTQIAEQEEVQKMNHEQILQDLSAIRDRAKAVWEKIDESTKDVLNYHDQTKKHYTETLDNLSRINSSVASIYNVLLQQKVAFDDFSEWISGYIGGTGDSLSILQTLLFHLCYLVLAAISASFLQTPTFSRILLLIFVPLNAFAELRGQNSLGFGSMTTLIILTTLGNWGAFWAWYAWNWCRNEKKSCENSHPESPMKAITNGSILPNGSASFSAEKADSPTNSSNVQTPDVRKLLSILENLYNSGALSPPNTNAEKSEKADDTGLGESQFASPNHVYEVISTPSQAKRDLMESLRDSPFDDSLAAKVMSSKADYTPATRRLSTSSRRSSTPQRPQCLATTKANLPCKLPSMEGSAFCYKHRV